MPAIRTSSASPIGTSNAQLSAAPAAGEGCLELTGVPGTEGCSELPRAHRRAGLRAGSSSPRLAGPEGWLRAAPSSPACGPEGCLELTGVPGTEGCATLTAMALGGRGRASASTTEHVFAIRLDPSYICES